MEPDYYWGEVSAFRNGEQWSGDIRGVDIDGLYGILCSRFDQKGPYGETFNIRRIPKKLGRFNIIQSDTLNTGTFVTSMHFTVVGGDALEGVYFIDPNDTTSFVEIRSIFNDIIEGEFQLVFLLDPDGKERHPHLPDTVWFADGVFRTKIMDVY